MDDVVKDFLVESYENLDRMDRDFVELEKSPSKETLGSIFRAVHTIKGTCGFLGFSKLEAVAHAGESLMSLVRDGALQITPQITDGLLAMVDAVREMLASIEAIENEGERDDSALIETLHALQSGGAHLAGPVATAAKAERPEAASNVALENMSIDALERLLEERAKSAAQSAVDAPAGMIEPSLTSANSTPAKIEKTAVKPAVNADAPQAQAEAKGAVSDSTVRVDVAILDKLMNLVGELVLSRNQIMQFASSQEDATFLSTMQHLNLVTGELQEGVMKTRMQPIGNVWNKFPRVVRDLATSCKKLVRVEMEGAETELDRTIIEAIKDPLTHVIRNSVDHGIEMPEARVAAGKLAEGRLLLRAFHEGGQVNIEITDDGGGIHPEKVCDKALQKGLITTEQAEHLTERELANLIFLPGFSTAEKVTNVSGRGVGMDVVKTNIEKIGGTVDVHSKYGQGTTLKIKIPLTLAIIPALMVTSGGDRYAIPQVSLLELVRLDGEHARKGVERVHGAPVYRLRGNLLPLVYLDHVFKLPRKDEAEDPTLNIVVLQADGRSFGLVVDGISDSKDIVVKPLGKHFNGLPAFSGATILGDGAVALILDVIGIFQCSNFNAQGRERGPSEATVLAPQDAAEQHSLLICRFGKESRVGIPLELVARLEAFPLSVVEKSGAHDVVQYRGEIMPLIRLSQALGGESSEAEGKQNLDVVVYRQHGCSVGLVVEQIADIVEERIKTHGAERGGYYSGTAVVQGRVIDILNVRAVVEAIAPELLAQEAA